MNSQTFTRAKKFINLFLILTTSSLVFADWKIDLSRRSKELGREKVILDDNNQTKPQETLFDSIMNRQEASQEIVVLNTDKGFIPTTVRVVKGRTYKIHVVNVNESEKNVSFIMDAFSEHHATFYGHIKSFTISPKKEGVFTFQSPETSAQGRVIVMDAPAKGDDRLPASE